jgi:hypothetical protein
LGSLRYDFILQEVHLAIPAKSAYILAEFLNCCTHEQKKIQVLDSAMKDAQNIFHLYTKANLLDFIANGGLENIVWINTKPWGNNPDPANPVYVDAYHFVTGGILGYIAFFKNKTGIWIIKSFHQSNERSGIMEQAILAARKKGIIE